MYARHILILSWVVMAVAPAARALDLVPLSVTGYVSAGESPINKHGHSVFRTVQVELISHSAWVERRLPGTEVATSLSYSRVRQAHSWFGYRDGEGDDNIRAESAAVDLRHEWGRQERVRLFGSIGTGPMWSNRRIPAATSRFNFNSHASLGIVLFPEGHHPLQIGYRFSHVSNAGLARRNPGLAVSSIFISTTRLLHR